MSKTTAIADAALLIEALNDARFPKVMEGVCRRAAQFDSTVVYAYHDERPPIDLYHSAPVDPAKHSLDQYQSAAYLLDPFFHACQRGIEAGVYRLRDFAPDHFFRSEYYRSYYAKTSIIDELGMFVPMSGGRVIVVSMSREGDSNPFRKKEIEAIELIEPVVRAAVLRHWHNPEAAELATPPGNGRYDTLPMRVQEATQLNNRPAVTNREAEVVSLILRGYSSVSIAAMLGISISTVKVHRKNIYAKLRISSQAELFSLFVPVLTQPAA